MYSLEEPAARAILEVLYGSGLRVGELARLDLTDLDLARGEARVMGKGKKERLVPLGGKSTVALTEYLAARAELRSRRREPDPRALFLNVRGGRLTPRAIQSLVASWGAFGAGRSDLSGAAGAL